MTPAADAALSHISWQRSQAPLVEICRRKFNPPAPNELTLAAFADRDIVPLFGAWQL
jgi:hypothetical protein